MKRLLLTFIVLFMAASAFAECAMYIEDIELKMSELGTPIAVPVKAHFSARVNAWEVSISYPEGLTPTDYQQGSNIIISYYDSNGEEKLSYATLMSGSNYRYFVAAILDAGYWQDPDGEDPNAWVSYGSVKWEAGDYDEMILLNLKPSVDFAGGDINISFKPYSSDDTRGGTVIENGDAGNSFYSVCHITVKDDEEEQTGAPVFSGYESENGYVVSITPSEDSNIYYRIIKNYNQYGEWTLYSGELLFIEQGYYRIEAYAKAVGKTASVVMAYEFVVQGLPQTDPPVISYSLTDEAVNVTATGAGEVKLYKDGVEVENPCTIARTSVNQTFTFSATAKEEGKLISETTTLVIDVPAKEVEPGEIYKPENVTVIPTTTTADVAWVDDHNTAWNLRYREILPGVNNNLLWDFEVDTNDNADTSLPGGWTSIDADGDGREWYHLNDTPNYDYVNHSGIGHVTSASYVHTTDSTGLALTPDNWLVSPRVKIDGELSFWACGQDPNWASEVFRVYTSTDKVNWVPISDDITATGEMTKYTFDLTPYACQNGYVAIRHYNVTDMFRLNVDDIAITYVKPAEWIYVENLDVPYYTIEDLDPGTNYEVQVQGINNNEETSDWTESIVFTTSVLLGDVNYDCMVNIADLNEMLNIIFYDEAFVIAADMNKDLIINVQDVVGLVHYLLNGEIPSISSNGRRAPKVHSTAHASLYWQDGVLYLNSDVPVSAINIINEVDGDITWDLDKFGMVVMQSTGTQGEHSVIFSFDRSTIPSGVNAIATVNSQHTSVVGAELSNLDSELITVNLNDQLTGLTSIQSDNEFNCHMDGSSLIIKSNAALRDIDVSVYTIDGRVVANQHVSFLDSGITSIDMSDTLKDNRYLIIVVRNGRQILATQKLTQNK